MKIEIGPYNSWIGPYQIAEKILFWKDKDKDDSVHKFGAWLSGADSKPSLLLRFCQWVESKRERKVKIHIDKYDTWNMNNTLAMIILPMLKQLKATKHGSPFVDDKDVPKNLRSTAAPPKENEWDIDANHEARWDWVMDEMIWTFEQLNDEDNDSQFHSGVNDYVFEKKDNGYVEIVNGPNHTAKFDYEGYKKHHNRISKGLLLFGKYYQGLWD